MDGFRTTLIAALVLGAGVVIQPAAAQQLFPTPEAAAAALVDAAGHPEPGQLERILGPGATALLGSGDADTDRRRREDFLAAAAKGSAVADGTDGSKVLVFGPAGWRFPIPLRQAAGAAAGGWSFDIAAGRQELIDRTIGRNELAAIAACADYVAAQQDYFAQLHDDDPVQQYALRLISTPGRHDGLYWEPQSPTDRSPLGSRIAAAALEKVGQSGAPRAYNGYLYRILTRQGPAAPGGAYDYKVKGRLLAGFALLAYPEQWQQTGVMSFFCDQRGQVYEANLGADTRAAAAAIRAFDPGEGWTAVRD